MRNDTKFMGRVLRKARENKSITQEELAEKIGVSVRTIGDIENGHRNPTFDTLYQLIQILDIPADLIFRSDDMPNTPEQEQFMCKFLNSTEQVQRITMANFRTVRIELRENNE